MIQRHQFYVLSNSLKSHAHPVHEPFLKNSVCISSYDHGKIFNSSHSVRAAPSVGCIVHERLVRHAHVIEDAVPTRHAIAATLSTLFPPRMLISTELDPSATVYIRATSYHFEEVHDGVQCLVPWLRSTPFADLGRNT